MNVFESVLEQMREEKPQLFHPRALENGERRQVEVSEIKIPIQRDLEELRSERISAEQVLDDNQVIYRLSPEELSQRMWEQIEPELQAFEESDEASRQREPYGQRQRQVGIELLAIYRPFHLYPKGDWGVLFFERAMINFCRWLFPYFLYVGYPPYTAKKMITYAIARHEFTHYLNELKAFESELTRGGQIFLPYLNSVYKATYPNNDCIEETVACVWQWDNAIMRSPANLRDLWRKVIKTCPFDAYRNGGDLDRQDVQPIEDRLSAQSNQCAIHPKNIPPIWGALPRPYVQPWTRYENVYFMMTRSGGGVLASQLNSGPIRKTIQVFHV